MLCSRCKKDEAYYIAFSLIEDRNPFLSLLMCPCGMRKFEELVIEIISRTANHFFSFNLEFPFIHYLKIRKGNVSPYIPLIEGNSK